MEDAGGMSEGERVHERLGMGGGISLLRVQTAKYTYILLKNCEYNFYSSKLFYKDTTKIYE